MRFTFFKAFSAALVVLVCAVGAASASRTPIDFVPVIPPLAFDGTLVPNEATNSFDTNDFAKPIPPGTEKFTVEVPETAKSMHGVGIDGGIYNNVMGAPVRAGRATSLTIFLKPGEYTLFDSYKDNRAKGFALKFTVFERDLFGHGCKIKNDEELKAVTDTLRVSRVKCKEAQKVAKRLYSHPAPTKTTTRGRFSCTLRSVKFGPEKTEGLRADCKRTRHRKQQRLRFTYRTAPAGPTGPTGP